MVNSPGAYIEKLSENILNTSFESFDQTTLENAKKRIIDLTGCLIGGAFAPGNLPLVELVKSWGGRKEATILVHGGKAPAYNVAMLNCIMARSYDFEAVMALVDDAEIASHISGTTVMTALTLGEAREVSGKELLTALLLGEDLACRLLAASGFGFTMGWDYIGTVNAFGATAIAGKLLGLTKPQMLNAFGILLNQLAGSLQNIWDGTLSFKLPQGLSARNAIFSAELSRVGWTGPEDALFSKFGYFQLYTEGCSNPEILTKDLGVKYYSEATLKPYPCCRANHTAIDCALNIVKEHEIDIALNVDRIEEIILRVPSRILNMFVGQRFTIRDIPQIDAAFNIRFCVANALLRKNVSLDHFQDELIRDPKISYLVDKIRIKEIDHHPQKRFKANLTIKMNDGKQYYAEVDFPKGDPIHNPLSQEEIKAKFLENVNFSQAISAKKAEKILAIIENIEEVNNVSNLTNLIIKSSD